MGSALSSEPSVESAERLSVVRELSATETTYAAGLNVLVTFYERPMRDAASELGLADDDFELIFGGLQAMLFAHRALARALDARVAEWSATSLVSDLFLGDFARSLFGPYSGYLSRFERAAERLTALTLPPSKKKRAPLAVWLESQASSLVAASAGANPLAFDLRALLITPVQRVPRYLLLLRALVKVTAAKHTDFRGLVAAAESMAALAASLNTAKRTGDAQRAWAALVETCVDRPAELDSGGGPSGAEPRARAHTGSAAAASAATTPAVTTAAAESDVAASARQLLGTFEVRACVDRVATDETPEGRLKVRTAYVANDLVMLAKHTRKHLRNVLRYKDHVLLERGEAAAWAVAHNGPAVSLAHRSGLTIHLVVSTDEDAARLAELLSLTVAALGQPKHDEMAPSTAHDDDLAPTLCQIM